LTKARHALALATIGVTSAAFLGGVAPLAHAGPSTSYFSATTTASTVHVSFTQSPADSIITGSLVSDDAGYATSGFDSGGSSEAAAAPFYPGTLVVGGPGLLCTDLFTCPFTPPAYPLLADASYPREPNAKLASNQRRVGIGTVLSVRPSTATAHADVDHNSSTTKTGKISLLASTPLALSIGSSIASTKVHANGSLMTIDVASAVSHVRVGPLLRINSIRTTDAITLRRGHPPVDQPRVKISGVTVAGQPATITASGIHVAGHKFPSLANKLIRSGIEVRTLGVARTDHANGARSSAGGVEIDFAAPVKNAPYVPNPLAGLPGFNQIPGVDLKGTYLGVVQLGGAGAAAARTLQPGGDVLAPASTGGRPSKHDGAARRGAGSGTTASGQVTAPPAAVAPPIVAANPQSGTSLRTIALSRDDLLTLYLVLAFGTAAIFLGWRGSVVVRRRPGRFGPRR
jgi:hypothetical protein